MPRPTYLLITPARNEGQYLRRTCESVVNQTIPPTLWLIADDGSTDDTRSIAEEYAAKHGFVRIVDVSSPTLGGPKDRLSRGADAVVFNEALASVDYGEFDYLGKLDADTEFEPDYYERLFAEFAKDDRLGICAGHFYEYSNGDLKLSKVPDWHVRGAGKLYRRRCFEQIGGVESVLAWDGIDELKAQMTGWYSRAFLEPKVIHLRPQGSTDGVLKGRARLGLGSYILRYHPLFVLARAVRLATTPPIIAGGLAYLYGYLKATLVRPPRYGDREVIRFMRRTQMQRLVGKQPYAMSGAEIEAAGSPESQSRG